MGEFKYCSVDLHQVPNTPNVARNAMHRGACMMADHAAPRTSSIQQILPWKRDDMRN